MQERMPEDDTEALTSDNLLAPERAAIYFNI